MQIDLVNYKSLVVLVLNLVATYLWLVQLRMDTLAIGSYFVCMMLFMDNATLYSLSCLWALFSGFGMDKNINIFAILGSLVFLVIHCNFA